MKTTFYYEVSFQIEAETIEEAEEIYAVGDWNVDGHRVFIYDIYGQEKELEI